jgi:hypothetical protein
MYYADWITDGIVWWGEQLWYFMQNLPPTDWVTSPYYEMKLTLYILPIILFYLFPWFLYFRLRRKKAKQENQVKIVTNKFTCAHCGYVPPHPPAGGTYYCGKCGKTTRLSSSSDFSLHQ